MPKWLASLLHELRGQEPQSEESRGDPLDPRVTVTPVVNETSSDSILGKLRQHRKLLTILGLIIGLAVGWTVVLARGGTRLSVSLVILVTIIGLLIVLRLIRGPLNDMDDMITRPKSASKRVARGLVPEVEHLEMESRGHPIDLIWWWIALTALQPLGVAIGHFSNARTGLIMWSIGMAVVAIRVYIWDINRLCFTNKRIFMVKGLIKVSYLEMPLDKVTDKTAVFTAPSMALAKTRLIKVQYLKLILESAGQDQALRTIIRIPEGPSAMRLLTKLVHQPSS